MLYSAAANRHEDSESFPYEAYDKAIKSLFFISNNRLSMSIILSDLHTIRTYQFALVPEAILGRVGFVRELVPSFVHVPDHSIANQLELGIKSNQDCQHILGS